MTDEELKSKALELYDDYRNFAKVGHLEDQAQSQEVKDFIHRLAVNMYRREEALYERGRD